MLPEAGGLQDPLRAPLKEPLKEPPIDPFKGALQGFLPLRGFR